MSFNWEVYKELNPDLQKAGLNTKQDFEQHYIDNGKKENRLYNVYQVYPDFNHVDYVNNYSDLKHLDKNKLEVHWIQNGKKEGRTYKKTAKSNKINLINGIDIIYWINLDRSKDRRVIMEKILTNIKVENKRIVGSDGKLEPNIKSNFIFIHPSNSSLGVYGCLLSHLRTIKEFWNSKKNIALILEDDISLDFMPYWNKDLKSIISQAPDNWDIIMLHYTDTNPDNHKNLYNKWNSKIYSTMAYVINRKGVEKIMKLYKNGKWAITLKTHISDAVVYYNCNTYVYRYPYFTTNNNMDSLIHNDHLEYHNQSKEFTQNIWLNG